MAESDLEKLRVENVNLRAQAQRLQIAADVTARLGNVLEIKRLPPEMAMLASRLIPCERAAVLVLDEENYNLRIGAVSRTGSTEDLGKLKNLVVSIYNGGTDPIVSHWLRGEDKLVENDTLLGASLFAPFAEALGIKTFHSLPLMMRERMVGVLLVEPPVNSTISETDRALLRAAAAPMAVAVFNAQVYSKTAQALSHAVYEMNLLHQVDRELNDRIALDHVFAMTLDWAMRYTNASNAMLALYNDKTHRLRVVAQYGYTLTNDQIELINGEESVDSRVALTGRAEVIPDVTIDPDFVPIAPNTRAKLVVPVMREERVAAIISLESNRLNAFSDEHQDFVEKLAARAGSAIDNGRLYTETAQEREKLSRILATIAEVVLVVDEEQRILLINDAALNVLRLYTGVDYAGKPYHEVFEYHSEMLDLFKQAKEAGETTTREVRLPGARTFYTSVMLQEGIGWIIVMRDITVFKEMDQLKSQLISTVSHDLKQPLTIMTGYIDLLEMHGKMDDYGKNFLRMVERSIRNMRMIIDELLDLAQLESGGVKLRSEHVSLADLLTECIEQIKPIADQKAIRIETAWDSLPTIPGDRLRLQQIFLNLIGNAVKYTQPEGLVHLRGEARGNTIRVTVQDNGIGIGPEDQAHIFERFYRVRRPENDNIEGTGLGLAIVKMLVEAHKGKVVLESKLGEGSQFHVTLPLTEEAV